MQSLKPLSEVAWAAWEGVIKFRPLNHLAVIRGTHKGHIFGSISDDAYWYSPDKDVTIQYTHHQCRAWWRRALMDEVVCRMFVYEYELSKHF